MVVCCLWGDQGQKKQFFRGKYSFQIFNCAARKTEGWGKRGKNDGESVPKETSEYRETG